MGTNLITQIMLMLLTGLQNGLQKVEPITNTYMSLYFCIFLEYLLGVEYKTFPSHYHNIRRVDECLVSMAQCLSDSL